MTLRADLRAHVLDELKKTPSPTVTQVKRRRTYAAFAGVASSMALTGAIGVALGGRPLSFVALSVVGWVLLAAVVTYVGIVRGKLLLGRSRQALVVIALGTAPAIFGWVLGCTLGWPSVREPNGTLATHIACLVTTLVLSLGPLVALAYARLATDPVHPRATGAAIGAAAGAWGGVLIDLHCPISHPTHVALAHVLPVLVYAALSGALGVRFFGIRPRA